MIIVNLGKKTHARLRRLDPMRILALMSLLCLVFLHPISYAAATEQPVSPIIIGLGDSIGEGVQGANANLMTQPFAYLNIFTWHVSVPFSLPLIESGPLGFIGDVTFRSRIDPGVVANNLAVSGADVHSILYDRADAMSIGEINSETDLVLFPRIGSQIEIAEEMSPPIIICWIGNNDVLSAVTSFDRYDASQMTPIADFAADFGQIVQRLGALDSVVLFANIPDVSKIGFLVDRYDLIKFLGADYGLAEGDYTSIVVMLLIKLGLNDGSLIQDPNYVLDASEVQIIQQRIDIFNQIIEEKVSAIDMPVVDVNTLFDSIYENPPVFLGFPLTTSFLGGLFSLDGVHPSNIGHALLTNAFIEKINDHFVIDIPLISQDILNILFLTDPSVDKDGDGRATGRVGSGLLETIGPILGISGDTNDFIPDSFLSEPYYSLKNQTVAKPDLEDVIIAFKQIFGLEIINKKTKEKSKP